ncbi:MAG: T9SS type A sorting domain-containing protein [Saprospiraceae bacterium]|nr:T9SS type A sorting domain-containing protein [Saprospiraceae bacterium]
MSNPAMIPNYVEWKSFSKNQDAADFIAIKLGELDGSTTTFANDHAVTRSTSVGDLLKLANQSTAIQSVNSYPNPFGNEAIRFDLKLINDAPIKIELFDINGKKIFAQEKFRSKGSQTIEIENPSNTAFVMYRISDGSKVFTGKLVR